MMKVFVYGTLKKGQPNSQLFDNTKDGVYTYVGEGRTVMKYPLVVASRYNIPFMLPVEGKGHTIAGEVYEVDAPMLEALDNLECHPDFYERQMIPVKMADNTTVDCACYMLTNFRPELLDLTFYDDYDSESPHPFVPRHARAEIDKIGGTYWSDVKPFS